MEPVTLAIFQAMQDSNGPQRAYSFWKWKWALSRVGRASPEPPCQKLLSSSRRREVSYVAGPSISFQPCSMWWDSDKKKKKAAFRRGETSENKIPGYCKCPKQLKNCYKEHRKQTLIWWHNLSRLHFSKFLKETPGNLSPSTFLELSIRSPWF